MGSRLVVPTKIRVLTIVPLHVRQTLGDQRTRSLFMSFLLLLVAASMPRLLALEHHLVHVTFKGFQWCLESISKFYAG